MVERAAFNRNQINALEIKEIVENTKNAVDNIKPVKKIAPLSTINILEEEPV